MRENEGRTERNRKITTAKARDRKYDRKGEKERA